MSKYYLDFDKYATLARQAAAEGCVLLKNENHSLPLKKGDKVAVFGRIASTYYKSGLGSGGLVNTRYVVGILDALREENDITLDQNVLKAYEDWIAEHPFDEGEGWGRVPWSQEEMPLDTALVDGAAAENDVALVIVGRTAGEDQDNSANPGSYLLTDVELDMISKVTARFQRTAVILNVGNIIDMKWVEQTHTPAVLYAWQGGQEGGHGVADILMGRVNPCGKLADTIAWDITDYPSHANFGGEERNFYKEDIYVGYRYFETFAKEKVQYPFGFGLSYTTFDIKGTLTDVTTDELIVSVEVNNTGNAAGKEVVQIYIEAPQGKMGKPARVLAGFAKTGELSPGIGEVIRIHIPKTAYASYDDSGVSGKKSAFVLEEGEYRIYVGSDVRSAKPIGSYEERELLVVQQLQEACAPVMEMERMKPSAEGDGYGISYEKTPLRTVDPYERAVQNREPEIAFTGNQGYQLQDVYEQKITMDQFVAQLTDDELIALHRGEGMCSPKVTAGCGGAFGGLSEGLRAYGIPAECCTDGPSGIRMDCGTKAFSMPNGTALASSFNTELIGELYHMTGLEMRRNRIDILLGPGMNIHRHPLNGRNFEYFSEDPLVTGKLAAAQLQGCEDTGTTLTIKHFATNNQEHKRQVVDAVVSERALREIYLKGFEIAVREGHARSVMTTYAPLNGIWTAGNYDLVTTILRRDWGFEGIVMTDWWAQLNWEGEQPDRQNHAPMVLAQNDLYMVTENAADMEQDNIKEALEIGRITRSELQRNVKNVLGFILKSPAMLHEMGKISEEELEEMKQRGEDDFSPEEIEYYPANEKDEIWIPCEKWDMKAGANNIFGVHFGKFGFNELEVTLKTQLSELAQLPISVYYDNVLKGTISIQGTNGDTMTQKLDMGMIFGATHFIKIYVGANGLEVVNAVLRLTKEIIPSFDF